ncbi:MAG: helix-turn-helix transcriptional regulator [Acidipropionibacterium sp.]|jgi:molybdopterin-binding protein|nr:helix-turn-helix transcriptional regulator [Acidipropionibacterium sp.]
MPSHRISDVATLLGISDDSVRRWIDQGQIQATKDDAGILRVDGADLAGFLATQQQSRQRLEDGSEVQSARNHIQGIITAVHSDPVMSQVDMVAGNARIVSLISTEAVNELHLEVGTIAVAQVKATNVSIELPKTR